MVCPSTVLPIVKLNYFRINFMISFIVIGLLLLLTRLIHGKEKPWSYPQATLVSVFSLTSSTDKFSEKAGLCGPLLLQGLTLQPTVMPKRWPAFIYF